jgi:pilus assembly protein CpaD
MKESIVMRRILTAALLATALATTACGPVNRGMESDNQPVIRRTDYVFDVSADALRSGSQAEARRLDGWFDALQLAYGDVVTLDDPSSYGDDATRAAIAAVLAHRGMLLGGQAPVTTGALQPGQVRVVVSRSSAAVPNCPDWSRPSQPEFAASAGSNFGCAVNSNLAAMIANPEDLVRGHADDGNADARSVNKAVKAYRDAIPSAVGGIKTESAKSGGGN